MDENVDVNLKDLDENLAGLTQMTEDPKSIKGALLCPHTHTQTHTHTHTHTHIQSKCNWTEL